MAIADLNEPSEEDAILRMSDRLIADLTAVLTPLNYVSLPIREFAPVQVSEEDGIILAVYVPDEDVTTATLGGPDGGKHTVKPRLLLHVLSFEGTGDSEALLKTNERRVRRLTGFIRNQVWRWRGGSSPAPEWHSLRFGQNPTTAYQRKPEKFFESVTQIILTSNRGNLSRD